MAQLLCCKCIATGTHTHTATSGSLLYLLDMPAADAEAAPTVGSILAYVHNFNEPAGTVIQKWGGVATDSSG
jgi:hypothetical protein